MPVRSPTADPAAATHPSRRAPEARPGHRPFRGRRPGALAAAGLLSASLAAQATPAGTQVYGTADLLEFACTTCPFGPGELLSDQTLGSLVNGTATTSVAASHLHRYSPAGVPVVGAGYAGEATIVGPDALPVLSVSASSTFLMPESPFGGYEPRLWSLQPNWPFDPQFNPALRYNGFVQAAAVQQYTIAPLGTDAMGFTLGVSFSGLIEGGSSHWASATVLVYANDYDPENPPGSGEGSSPFDGGIGPIGQGFAFIDGAMLGAQASAQAFSIPFDVSFDLFDGDAALFVVVELTGSSGMTSENVGGFVDAMNGLQLSFTAGNTSLLTPVLAPVPEPGGAWLLAAGLAGLGGWRLRQRRPR
jgi:hypothetical protein